MCAKNEILGILGTKHNYLVVITSRVWLRLSRYRLAVRRRIEDAKVNLNYVCIRKRYIQTYIERQTRFENLSIQINVGADFRVH